MVVFTAEYDEQILKLLLQKKNPTDIFTGLLAETIEAIEVLDFPEGEPENLI